MNRHYPDSFQRPQYSPFVSPSNEASFNEEVNRQWQTFIEKQVGFILPPNQSNWLWQAVNKLARQKQTSPKTLLELAATDQELVQKIIEVVLIPQSRFFRHQSTLDFIAEYATQSLLAPHKLISSIYKPVRSAGFTHSRFAIPKHYQVPFHKNWRVIKAVDHTAQAGGPTLKNDSSTINVWSVGCSTGQEVWSIAMTLEALNTAYHVWGLDVNHSALNHAYAGQYDAKQLHEIPSRYKRFTIPDNAYWSVATQLRRQVNFLHHNLIEPTLPEIPLADIIVCQNVLIYFRQFEQRDILSRLVSQLKVGGYLILAPAEASQWHHPLMVRHDDLKINAWRRIQ